jgi:hypothetical protein
MSLRDPRPGLRTLHNGSNAVAKAAVTVPEGGELTVPDEVAVQLLAQASGAFKVGPTPQATLDAIAARNAPAEVVEPEPVPAIEAVPQAAATKQARRK